jgi:hypothetical protein
MGTKFRRHTIIELSLLAFFNPFLGRLGTWFWKVLSLSQAASQYYIGVTVPMLHLFHRAYLFFFVGSVPFPQLCCHWIQFCGSMRCRIFTFVQFLICWKVIVANALSSEGARPTNGLQQRFSFTFPSPSIWKQVCRGHSPSTPKVSKSKERFTLYSWKSLRYN